MRFETGDELEQREQLRRAIAADPDVRRRLRAEVDRAARERTGADRYITPMRSDAERLFELAGGDALLALDYAVQAYAAIIQEARQIASGAIPAPELPPPRLP